MQQPSGYYSVLSIFGGSDTSTYSWSYAFLRLIVRYCFIQCSGNTHYGTYLLALTLSSRGKNVLVAST